MICRVTVLLLVVAAFGIHVWAKLPMCLTAELTPEGGESSPTKCDPKFCRKRIDHPNCRCMEPNAQCTFSLTGFFIRKPYICCYRDATNPDNPWEGEKPDCCGLYSPVNGPLRCDNARNDLVNAGCPAESQCLTSTAMIGNLTICCRSNPNKNLTGTPAEMC